MTSLLVTTAVAAVLLAAIAVTNARSERRRIAAGRCPDCAGQAGEYINQNGLSGCISCNDGTLQSHNEFRSAMGMRPRT